MAIIVSGTPGTGKTTFAKKLSNDEGLTYLDVNKIIDEHGLSEGLDKDRDAKIIDVKKLNKVLIEIIKKDKDIVIDSHLSHYLPKKHVDICYITKCSLKELKKRLIARGYSDEKVRENLDAEILDVCRIEAEEAGHKIKIIQTD
jgi:adenylate kinase